MKEALQAEEERRIAIYRAMLLQLVTCLNSFHSSVLFTKALSLWMEALRHYHRFIDLQEADEVHNCSGSLYRLQPASLSPTLSRQCTQRHGKDLISHHSRLRLPAQQYIVKAVQLWNSPASCPPTRASPGGHSEFTQLNTQNEQVNKPIHAIYCIYLLKVKRVLVCEKKGPAHSLMEMYYVKRLV